MWLSLPYIFNPEPAEGAKHRAGAVVHSLLIYVISFIVLKNNDVFNLDKKKKSNNLNLSNEEMQRYHQKIVHKMEEEKVYLDTELTLTSFSEQTGISTYILSYVLSESVKSNFLQLVNSYRIEEAKRTLEDSGKQHLSIASIAYDCGFNTLSSFNTSFKKFTGVTPSDYKKKKVA